MEHSVKRNLTMACEVILLQSEQKYLVLDLLHLPFVPFLPITPLQNTGYSIRVYEQQGYKITVLCKLSITF